MTTSRVSGLQVEDSPVGVAWRAVGSPVSSATASIGHCARCWAKSPLVPIDQVVSRGFTSFDDWAAYPGAGVCHACAWAYTSPSLRTGVHCVTRVPADLQSLTGSQLRQLLSSPVTPTTAVTVPRRAGRRHVLPHVRWGRVALDDLLLEWTRADADRLAVVEQLRLAGATPQDLAAPAPAWRLLAHSPSADRGVLLQQWRLLDPWRAAPAWLDLAVRATASTR